MDEACRLYIVSTKHVPVGIRRQAIQITHNSKIFLRQKRSYMVPSNVYQSHFKEPNPRELLHYENVEKGL